MSLSVIIERVFTCEPAAKKAATIRSVTETFCATTTAATAVGSMAVATAAAAAISDDDDEAAQHHRLVDCVCKVFFARSGQPLCQIGQVSVPSARRQRKRQQRRSSSARAQRQRSAAGKEATATGDHDRDMFLTEAGGHDDFDDHDHFDNRVRYQLPLGVELAADDRLEVVCYTRRHYVLLRPFGKYTMLLDLLRQKQDEYSSDSRLCISDHLLSPQTNRTLGAKIVFHVVYDESTNSNGGRMYDSIGAGGRAERYEWHRMPSALNSQSVAIDFIRTILKTGEFALEHFEFNYNEAKVIRITTLDFGEEVIKNFIRQVGNCATTLKLALNLVMAYELSVAQKVRLRRSIVRNNPFDYDYDFGDIGTHTLLNQLFYLDLNEKITSWQVRVRIIELKHLVGLGETVYCLVEIGNVRFRTKEKNIDNLKFHDDDEVFIARIEYKDHQKASNFTITISVFYKNFIYADTLIGKFQTDFGTIYRQPGHEVYHKWGEILSKNDERSRQNNIRLGESQDEMSCQSEFTHKGFVKFDIILQSKGDKAKIHYEEKSEDNDEIENHLLVPYGLNEPRQFMQMIVTIHRANILLTDNTSLMSQLKDSVYSMLASAATVASLSSNASDPSVVINMSDKDGGPVDEAANEATKCELNPFVRITFGGMSKRTPVIAATSKPVWDFALHFNFRYPPLVRLVKIELCTQHTVPVGPAASSSSSSSSPADAASDPPKNAGETVLAKEYVSINELSNYRRDNPYMPTFGPRHVDLYSEPNNCRNKKNSLDECEPETFATAAASVVSASGCNGACSSGSSGGGVTQNEMHIEPDEKSLGGSGAFYVARLFMGITSRKSVCNPFRQMFNASSVTSSIANATPTPTTNSMNVGAATKAQNQQQQPQQQNQQEHKMQHQQQEPSTKDFVAFVILNEVSMIDSRYAQGDISFQLCVGTHGYRPSTTARGRSKTSSSSGLCNLTEPVRPVQFSSQMPAYAPFEKSKKCLTLRFAMEDMRFLMYKNNFLTSNLKEMEKSYQQIKAILCTTKVKRSNLSESLSAATSVYKQIGQRVRLVKEYLKQSFLTSALISELDKYRVKQINAQFSIVLDLLSLLLKLVGKFRGSSSNDTFKFYIDLIIRNCLLKVKSSMREPLNYFPDVSLWFLFRGQPVGVCTLKANEVMWSADEQLRGIHSARMIYTNMKSLVTADFDDPEKENVARIKIFAWLGLASQVDELLAANSLPVSFRHGSDIERRNELGLPTEIRLLDRHIFQLNAYLYQGRGMLLLDIAGESDPFARISITNQSVVSRTIDNSVNPTWNEALCIPQVFLYGRLEELYQNPPEVIVDLYDEDPFNQKEFMGRFYAKPVIGDGSCSPPKLRWFKLYHSYEPAGDILASFELINLADHPVLLPETKEVKAIKSATTTTTTAIKSFSSSMNLGKNRSNRRPDEIPPSIKPNTRPYTLEIMYWGLRNITERTYLTLGQQKVSIQIEIGDNRLEHNWIEKCASNANFILTHRRHTIELPEEDEYKPHLNIRCECNGSIIFYPSLHHQLETMDKILSKRILIGSCSIKSIGDYCMDNASLSAFCKMNSNRNLIHSISLHDDVKNNQSMLSSRKQTLMHKRIHGAAKSMMLKKRNAVLNAELDLDYLDWWSKYFASVNSQHGDKKLASEAVSGGGASDDNNNDFSSDNNSERTESDSISLRRIYKKKEARRSSAGKPSSKKKIPMAPKRHLQKIQVYDCELEKKFKLTDTLESFPLIVGKNKLVTKHERAQCQFKGKFMLYDENSLSSENANLLHINGGFLKRIPPNLPVRVKVHVYIIKASIVNPIHLIGKFEPFIQLTCGQTEITEKLKNDSVEPLIGRCFELVARFPSESQLTIAIKNWNILEGTELIGHTVIDLEDRFYANCYASCGLPRKFQLTGYNAWRDRLLPRQLLHKLCRKFGLQKPKYNGRTLTVWDADGVAHEFSRWTASSAYTSASKTAHTHIAFGAFDATAATAVAVATSAGLGAGVTAYATDEEAACYYDDRFMSYSSEGSNNASDAEAETASNHTLLSVGNTGTGVGNGSTSGNVKSEAAASAVTKAAGASGSAAPPVGGSSSSSAASAANRHEEQLSLNALNNWIRIGKVALVPEHVETRSLYNPEAGSELEQGKIQMWIDIFPDGDTGSSSSSSSSSATEAALAVACVPRPVDVSVRKPKRFQLRVIVFNTKEVILDDTNVITGEKSSDIYVRGHLCESVSEAQRTDVHYRSLDGEGNFNWRFLFNFDYLPAEKRIVTVHRQRFGLVSIERKHKPVLRLQCYDADQFTADDLLGHLELNLCSLVKGANSVEACSAKMLRQGRWPHINLFKKRQHRGWWPFVTARPDGSLTLTGKVEAEFCLLTEQEALNDPVGEGRNPPQPLPDPQRPETSFLWFAKPYQTFKYIIWKNYWRQIILFGLLLILIMALIIFFVQLPSALITRIIS